MINIEELLKAASEKGFIILLPSPTNIPTEANFPEKAVLTGKNPVKPRSNSREVRLAEAVAELRSYITICPMDANDIFTSMAAKGFGRNITYEAGKALNVAKKVIFMNGVKTWYWEMPEQNDGKGGICKKLTKKEVLVKKLAAASRPPKNAVKASSLVLSKPLSETCCAPIPILTHSKSAVKSSPVAPWAKTF